MENIYKVKYVENNNTILFEKKMKITDGLEKGERARWINWYEVDMDDASRERLSEWVEHLQEKNWVDLELLNLFVDKYDTYLVIKKQ